MPETTENTKYYSQDLSFLSQHFDVIVPMVYKGIINKIKIGLKKQQIILLKIQKKQKYGLHYKVITVIVMLKNYHQKIF